MEEIERHVKGRKRIGIFSFTSCEGCQLQVLDLQHRLIRLLDYMDIIYFKMADDKSKMGKTHISFVEGAISNRKERDKLRKIRENSKYLVAIGACACHGGIPSLKNTISGKKNMEISRSKTYPIQRFVKVDYRMTGCPIEKEEFVDVLKALLLDKVPHEINEPVCVECNRRGIECIMKKGVPCMGPITAAGCNARCPAVDTPCEGCRGTIEDANVGYIRRQFKKLGMNERNLSNRLNKFMTGAEHALHKKGRISRRKA